MALEVRLAELQTRIIIIAVLYCNSYAHGLLKTLLPPHVRAGRLQVVGLVDGRIFEPAFQFATDELMQDRQTLADDVDPFV